METKPEYTTKALVPYQPLTPSAWQMIMQVAEPIHLSRLFGTSSPEQAASIMLKGYELGLPLTASFEFIDSFLDQTTLKPRGALALIHQSPLCAKIEIEDIVDDQGNPWACRVYMERTNGFSHEITVTMDDARRAQLVKPNGNWEKWPANLLRWRATGFCADVVFPDIGGGMKRTDELANVDQDGNIIDADPWSVVVDPEPEKTAITFDYLLDHWTTEQIMEANGGQVPQNGQLETLVLKLERIDAEKMEVL